MFALWIIKLSWRFFLISLVATYGGRRREKRSAPRENGPKTPGKWPRRPTAREDPCVLHPCRRPETRKSRHGTGCGVTGWRSQAGWPLDRGSRRRQSRRSCSRWRGTRFAPATKKKSIEPLRIKTRSKDDLQNLLAKYGRWARSHLSFQQNGKRIFRSPNIYLPHSYLTSTMSRKLWHVV